MYPIGFDIGHSAVKIALRHGDLPSHILIPSSVMPSIHISDENERARADADTVAVFDKKTSEIKHFFIGETAVVQGAESATGLHMNWIGSLEYSALLIAAHHRITDMGIPPEEQLLIMGLPVHEFQKGRDILTDVVKYRLPDVQFKIFMQPMLAYHSIMLDDQGNPSHGRSISADSWAIIDIGHFTTDIISMEGGRFIETRSASCRGVSRACQQLISILAQAGISDVTMIEAEQALRTNYIQNYGRLQNITEYCDQAKDVLIADIIDLATRLLSDSARRRTGVLLTGGGAPILYDRLHSIWPNTELAPFDRFSVAEGARRMGASAINAGLVKSANES